MPWATPPKRPCWPPSRSAPSATGAGRSPPQPNRPTTPTPGSSMRPAPTSSSPASSCGSASQTGLAEDRQRRPPPVVPAAGRPGGQGRARDPTPARRTAPALPDPDPAAAARRPASARHRRAMVIFLLTGGCAIRFPRGSRWWGPDRPYWRSSPRGRPSPRPTCRPRGFTSGTSGRDHRIPGPPQSRRARRPIK